MSAGSPDDGGFVRDPGLQPERTALAWSRTGLALAANAVLTIRSGAANHAALVLWLGAALLVAAIVLVPLGTWRKHQLLRPEAPRAPDARLLLGVSALALVACGTAILGLLPRLQRLVS